MPVLHVANGWIETPSATYALNPEADDIAIHVGQGYRTVDGLRVDFTDSNVQDIVVSLRTLQAHRDGSDAHIGLLIVEDRDVFAVTCES